MKRVTLYSRSGQPPGAAGARALEADAARRPPPGSSGASNAAGKSQASAAPPAAPEKPARLRTFYRRFEKAILVGAGAAFALILAWLAGAQAPEQRRITQRDIERAVLHAIEKNPLPSRAAKAAEIIRPSVVRVRGMGDGEKEGEEIEQGVGSGVVIKDDGTILTNLHVVHGAKKVKVVFADGMEADAVVTGARPEHDLAVLRPATVPDDLVSATMRGTGDLLPGDDVVAVGFPFGIGPSVTAGVVSGLRREFQSPEGKRLLTNLIQFDAAANPGSSGGPLVTVEGEVVGIVTGILNPTEQRVFIGIGFAVPIENAAGAVGLPPF